MTHGLAAWSVALNSLRDIGRPSDPDVMPNEHTDRDRCWSQRPSATEAPGCRHRIVDAGNEGFGALGSGRPWHDPWMTSRGSSPVLVGRRREMLDLTAALRRARDGSAGVVVVSGEAGIGKSCLLDHAGGKAREAGMAVLVGEDAPYAYGPLMGILRGLRRQVGDPGLRRMLTGVRRPLVRLVPGLDLDQASDSDEWVGAQASLFEAVLDLVGHLGGDRPVLLAMEDVHRADESTLDLIEFLATNLTSERAALVVTCRTGEARQGRVPTWLAELVRQPRVERIELARLPDDEIVELLSAIGGSRPARDVAERISQRSQGNPFFIEELFASGGGEELPAGLEDLLVARLANMSPATRQVLRAGAVLGARPHDRLLGAITELSTTELRSGLQAAADHGLLVAEGGPSDHYRFRHDLVREAVHRRLLVDQRRRLHGLAAEELEAHPELAGGGVGHVHAELARHWHLAGEPDRAFTASIAASEEAVQVHAASEALAHLVRARQLWDDISPRTRTAAGPRYELELRCIEAALLLDDPRVALEHTEHALEQPDVPLATQAQLHVSVANFLRPLGRGQESQVWVDRALGLLPTEPSPERADVLTLTSMYHLGHGRSEEAQRCSSEAVEVARAVGDRACEAMALNYHGLALQDLGQDDEGVRLLRESLAISLQVGAGPAPSRGQRIRDPVAEGTKRGYNHLCEVLRRAGRFAEAVEIGNEGRAWAARLRSTVSEEALLLNTVDALVSGQRWLEADELLSSVRPVSRANVMTDVFETLLRARVGVAQGRLGETAELLDRLSDSVPGSELEPQHHSTYLATVVALALARDQHDQVRQAVTQAQYAGQRIADEHGRVTYQAAAYWEPTLVDGIRSEVERALDADQDPVVQDDIGHRVDELLHTLRQAVDQAPGGTHVRARLTAALAAGEAEAARLDATAHPSVWQEAVDTAAAAGLPYREAHARFRLAEALLVQGRRDEAAEALEQSDQTASELGAELLRQQIAVFARRARLGLDTAGPDEKLGSDLTAREIDVLELLAQGHTNRQISQRLFVSEKTVEGHVTNILTKLQVDNRTAAAAVARQRHLVGP